MALSPDELTQYIGKEIGISDWFPITQERINRFAEATEDFQQIHVDPEYAASIELGTTVAHGYLLISLIPKLLGQCGLEMPPGQMVVNRGITNWEFKNYVRVNQDVRIRVKVADAKAMRGHGLLVTFLIVLEVKDERRPACQGEIVFYFPKQ